MRVMLINVGGGLGPKVRKRDTSIEYLYLFDAENLTIGTPPADVISEDSSDAYEIVDLGGDQGKGLRKKPANTATKRAFFNTYNTFLVPVLARYEFYMTNVSAFTFAFGVNLTASQNTGGRVVGFLRDAGTGHAKHNTWRANTNADFLTSDGGMQDLVGLGYDYKIPLTTGVLYIAEVWRDQVTGRQRLRVSADLGATRYNTCENASSLAQSRVGFVDGVGMAGQIHLKRVEVLPLVV